MFIIVSKDGRIWNWMANSWDKEPAGVGQTYAEKYVARRAAVRVESLQGSLFDGVDIMTYGEWAKQTGETW